MLGVCTYCDFTTLLCMQRVQCSVHYTTEVVHLIHKMLYRYTNMGHMHACTVDTTSAATRLQHTIKTLLSMQRFGVLCFKLCISVLVLQHSARQSDLMHISWYTVLLGLLCFIMYACLLTATTAERSYSAVTWALRHDTTT
jgi:hypothetical protein